MDFLRGEPIFGLKNQELEPGRTRSGRKGGRDHQMTVSCDPDVASETSHDTKRKSAWEWKSSAASRLCIVREEQLAHFIEC